MMLYYFASPVRKKLMKSRGSCTYMKQLLGRKSMCLSPVLSSTRMWKIAAKAKICTGFHNIQMATQRKYLALPIVISRSKEEVFGFIRDRVKAKLAGWKDKLLSPASKEVLIKSMVQALPTYTMSYFKLSKKLCKDINSSMANFW
ncbi:hypothetical protein ACH5RR_037321 [Cinchona calisaya]|uniref:Reverse transcriptase n=1 Tax=Cinchona calisaya TaxID=153742 RepID=A0ABD2Y5S4_9GENT